MSVREALAQLRAGCPQAGASLLEEHLAKEPGDGRAWFLLGACRDALRDFHSSAVAFSRSIDISPHNLEAHLALITVLRAGGDAFAALMACESGLAAFPSNARLHHAAAVLLEDLQRNDEALIHYDSALASDPYLETALRNRGLLLTRIGRLEDALFQFERYVESYPESAAAYGMLADVFLALGKYTEALEAIDSNLRFAANDGTALVRRGVALACLRRFPEAKAVLDFCLTSHREQTVSFIRRVAPAATLDHALSPENIFFSRQYMAMGKCDWGPWEDIVSEARKAAQATALILEPAAAFMAQHLPLDGVERWGISRHMADHVETRVPVLSSPPRRRSGLRIRVGILSPDYREHLNAYLLLPLFELADRQRFEMYAYSLAPDDGSMARVRIAAAADHLRELHTMSDRDAALAIRGDDIDILVDAAGHTAGGRFSVVAQRPARRQALYLGFSGSMASTRLDHAIVDRMIASQGPEWSESLVYLPHTWFLYDFRTSVPEGKVARRDYDLPEDAFVYCAFHRAEKISPDVFQLWLRILDEVSGSVLWLLDLPAAAKRNLRAQASKHGIEPARLIFAPFEPRHGDRYLPRQRLGDLMLDALYHNAMTTACDALGSGLPVLTLKGSALASRGGASLVTAAGLPELVVYDRETYVDEAVRLARDPKCLASYREKLNSREGPLFDTAGRVRELERCFEQMMTRL